MNKEGLALGRSRNRSPKVQERRWRVRAQVQCVGAPGSCLLTASVFSVSWTTRSSVKRMGGEERAFEVLGERRCKTVIQKVGKPEFKGRPVTALRIFLYRCSAM